MHFSKVILSAATLALSTIVVANPIAQPAAEQQQQQYQDRELPAESIEFIKRAFLEDRQGWTCAFLGGEKGCQVKCFLLKGTGGYCSSKNVCTCH